MWKTPKNKPNSVTPEIKGNKGLLQKDYAYYRRFKSVVIDENTSLMTMLITIKKKSLIQICLPLTLLLCAFFINHCTDTVAHTGLEKNEKKYDGEILFPKPTYLDKNFISRLH